MKLVIGNKNYSSWSLRPWILLKYFKVPFDEVLIPLFKGNFKAKILRYSPAGKVPVLVHGTARVWESLAICQYIADIYPRKNMWPKKLSDRAQAYCVSQEMHSGFAPLRANMPMNLRGNYPGQGLTSETKKDIARVTQIWSECRSKFKKQGPFLFGHFTVADAMFVPVATRFKTYGVPLSGLAAEYMETVLSLPEYRKWHSTALKEPMIIEMNEIYNPLKK